MTEKKHKELNEILQEIDEHQRILFFLQQRQLIYPLIDIDAPRSVSLSYINGQGIQTSGKFITISFPSIESLKEDLKQLQAKYESL